MWISKARYRVMRGDADRGRTLSALYAAEQEAHRLSLQALDAAKRQAALLDERLSILQHNVMNLERELAAARKGSWRWSDPETVDPKGAPNASA